MRSSVPRRDPQHIGPWGHTVVVPSSSLSEVGLGQKNEDRCGLGQENEDRCGLGASEIEEAGPRSRLKINIRGH